MSAPFTRPATLAVTCMFVALAGSAHADPREPVSPDKASDHHGLRYQVHFGMAAAGPLLFNDIPDQRLEQTNALEYGGRLAFLLGSELHDLHRVGVGFAGGMLAQSPSRTAALLTPFAIYEIGHPLVLQATAGYAIGVGTGGYADQYGGVSLGAAVRYSFRSLEHESAVGVSVGVAANLVLATSDIRYSSVFLGPQIELTFHSDAK